MKAFPSANDVKIGDIGTPGHAGMDLRDYFAAKIVQGLMANPEAPFGEDFEQAVIWACEQSYAVADAMMKAREL